MAVAGHRRVVVSRDSASATVPILPGGMLSCRGAAMGAKLGKLLQMWGQSKKNNPRRSFLSPGIQQCAVVGTAWSSLWSWHGLSGGLPVPGEAKPCPAMVNPPGSASASPRDLPAPLPAGISPSPTSPSCCCWHPGLLHILKLDCSPHGRSKGATPHPSSSQSLPVRS